MRTTIRVSVRLAGSLCLALAAWPAAAQTTERTPAEEGPLAAFFAGLERGQPDIVVQTATGDWQPARRCSTPDGDARWRAAVEESLALWRGLFPTRQERRRSIPVAFHVVHSRRRGHLTDEQVQAQIDVLNDAFDSANFTFTLSSLDRTRKKRWFRRCMVGSPAGGAVNELTPFGRMTGALAIDPAHNVNIYSCRSEIYWIREEYPGLGFSTLPGHFDESDPANAVLLHYQSLPGGELFPYNEGDSGAHELGHYLGLLHTFFPCNTYYVDLDLCSPPDGCTPPGDEVNDTPYEMHPDYTCEIGRDTCFAEPGDDPVTNYMDFGPDSCVDHFTAGQRRRMNDMIDLFRPSLGD